MPERILPSADFGSRAPAAPETSGVPSGPETLTNQWDRPSGLDFDGSDPATAAAAVEWLAACDRSYAQLRSAAGDAVRLVTVPWVADSRSFLVLVPATGMAASDLAGRLALDDTFRAQLTDRFLPIASAVVIGGPVGPDLHEALAGHGIPLTVHQSSGPSRLVTPGSDPSYPAGGFALGPGAFWRTSPGRTRHQMDIVVRELAEAYQQGWRYAPTAPVGGPIPLDDRTATLALVGEAYAATAGGLESQPVRLDFVALNGVARRHRHPEVVVRVVVAVLRARSVLNQVEQIADLRHGPSGWTEVPIPAEVRRMFTVTDHYVADGDRAVRPVVFGDGLPLLSGAAAEAPPETSRPFAVTGDNLRTTPQLAGSTSWLAEAWIDARAAARPAPRVTMAGDTTYRANETLLESLAEHIRPAGGTLDDARQVIAAPSTDDPHVAGPARARVVAAPETHGFGRSAPREGTPATDQGALERQALAMFRAAVRSELSGRGRPRESAVHHALGEADRRLLADVLRRSGWTAAQEYAGLLALGAVTNAAGSPAPADTETVTSLLRAALPALLPAAAGGVPPVSLDEMGDWTAVRSLTALARELHRDGGLAVIRVDRGDWTLLYADASGIWWVNPRSGTTVTVDDVPDAIRGSRTASALIFDAEAAPRQPTMIEPVAAPPPPSFAVRLGGDVLGTLHAVGQAEPGGVLAAALDVGAAAAQHHIDATGIAGLDTTDAAELGRRSPDTATVAELVTLAYADLATVLTAQAMPGGPTGTPVRARDAAATRWATAGSAVQDFLAQHATVLRGLIETRFRADQPTFDADLAAERDLPPGSEVDLWALPLYDHRTGAEIITAGRLLDAFLDPDPAAVPLDPVRLGLSPATDRPQPGGHLLLEAPAPMSPADAGPVPAALPEPAETAGRLPDIDSDATEAGRAFRQFTDDLRGPAGPFGGRVDAVDRQGRVAYLRTLHDHLAAASEGGQGGPARLAGWQELLRRLPAARDAARRSEQLARAIASAGPTPTGPPGPPADWEALVATAGRAHVAQVVMDTALGYPAPAPWFSRQAGLLGDGYVVRVEPIDADVLATLLDDVDRGPGQVPGLRNWLAGVLGNEDPREWDENLLIGRAGDLDGRFVRISLVNPRFQPQPAVNRPVAGETRYKSKYGDTLHTSEQDRRAPRTTSLPLVLLQNLSSQVFHHIAFPLTKFEAATDHTLSDRHTAEIQSGNRPLVNDMDDFRLAAGLRIEIDGTEIGTWPLPSQVVVGLPRAFGSPRLEQPSGDSVPVNRPEALLEEDFTINAVGFEPVLADLAHALRARPGLTAGDVARIIQAVRREVYNEKTARDRGQWFTNGAWVSPYLDVELPAHGLRRDRRFQGWIRTVGVLNDLREVGVSDSLLIRNDIAGTSTRRHASSRHSRAGASLGAESPAYLRGGQIIISPRADLITMSRKRVTTVGNSGMAQSKTALMHRDRQRRYAAHLGVHLELTSNVGRIERLTQIPAELGVPEQRAGRFEKELERAVHRTLATRAEHLPGRPALWERAARVFDETGREVAGWVSTMIRRDAFLRPFPPSGIRTASDLRETGRLASSRGTAVQVVVPAGDLGFRWRALDQMQGVSVVRQTPPSLEPPNLQNAEPVPPLRYLMDDTLQIVQAQVIDERTRSVVGVIENPAARRTAEAPVKPAPVALAPKPAAPASVPQRVPDVREPATLAARAGLGPGVVKEMPGAHQVLGLVNSMVVTALRGQQDLLDPERLFDVQQGLTVRFGVPGLRGHVRTLLDGVVAWEFTEGRRTYRIETSASLGELVRIDERERTGVDVQNRAASAYQWDSGQETSLGGGLEVGARGRVHPRLTIRGRVLETDGSRTRSSAHAIQRDSKTYRRRVAPEGVIPLRYSTSWRVIVQVLDGRRQVARLDHRLEGPGFAMDVLIPEAYLPDPALPPQPAAPDPVVVRSGPLNRDGTPDRVVEGFAEGPTNYHVMLNHVRHLAPVVEELMGGDRGRVRVDLHTLLSPTFLEGHAAEMLTHDGYLLPLLAGNGTAVESLRLRMKVLNPTREGTSTGVRHEEYLEADHRVVHKQASTWHGGAHLGLGGLFSPGSGTHPEPDSHHSGSAADQYAANHIALNAAYAPGRSWGREESYQAGGFDISIATVSDTSYDYSADVIYKVEHLRQGDHEPRSLSIGIRRGLELSAPESVARDLGLPVPAAADPAPPAIVDQPVPILPDLVAGFATVERMASWRVLPDIRQALRREGVAVNDLRTAAVLESALGNQALRTGYPQLRRDGLYVLLAEARPLGAMRLTGVRVTASEGAMTFVRRRPEVKVTSGGQAFQKTAEGTHEKTAHHLTVNVSGRGQIPHAIRLGGGAAGGREWESSAKAVENTMSRDIRRAATRTNGAAEFSVELTFQVHIEQRDVPSQVVETLRDLRDLAAVGARHIGLTAGRLPQWLTDLFTEAGPARPVVLPSTGSARLLTPVEMTVPAALRRTDLPVRERPMTPRPATVGAAQEAFSREVADVLQVLDVSGHADLTEPAPGRWALADPAFQARQTLWNRANIKANIGSLLRGTYRVDEPGGRFTGQVVLGRSTWLTAVSLDALAFPEVNTEGEHESESGTTTDGGFHLAMGNPDARYRGLATLAHDRATGCGRRAAHSTGAYVEHNRMLSGKFEVHRFDVRYVRTGADGRSLHVDSPGGLIAFLPADVAQRMRETYPDLMDEPGLRMPSGARIRIADVPDRAGDVMLREGDTAVTPPDTPLGSRVHLHAAEGTAYALVTGAAGDRRREELPADLLAAVLGVARAGADGPIVLLPDRPGGLRRQYPAQLAAATGRDVAVHTSSLLDETVDPLGAIAVAPRWRVFTAPVSLPPEIEALVRLAGEVEPDDRVGSFLGRAFPTGVRLDPVDEHDVADEVRSWYREAVDSGSPVIFRPAEWGEVAARLELTGADGIVVVDDVTPYVLRRAEGRVWRVELMPAVATAEPFGLAGRTDPPPRAAMGFNRCSVVLR
ncbi:hypothetical protein ACGFJ7_45500 [Actinoplanes sp. NPDC048988]|uniref:hypothetical protein n=1 Tax=Actinoplanes sp. NPDC048988 TaxID=3363901 RepID=UPI00371D914E